MFKIIQFLRNLNGRRKYGNKSTQEIFTDIMKKKVWGDGDSVSGTGSGIVQTKSILEGIPLLLKKYQVKSILDAPCGDYNWMQNVELNDIDYIGADIVPELIEQNKGHFSSNNINFIQLDLIKDKLPKVDLVFCRDCFVHLSLKEIRTALWNIKKSGSKYLLTSTFTSRKENIDIQTGLWRPLNFQESPFEFEPPLELIVEGNTENNGAFKDKSLGLWEISSLDSK